MDLEEAAKLIASWASEKNQIAKVQFFGSRVKGTYQESSDLDVAITLIPGLDESNGLSTWFHFCDEWTTELNRIIPHEVHVEWEAGEDTARILKGLDEASYLVYEKQS